MKPKSLFHFIIFMLCTFIIFSCSKSDSSGSTPNPGGTTGNSVNIVSMSYSPSTITVKAGTAVKWTNTDANSAHTVTSKDGVTFSSGNIASGSSYTYTPSTAGTFQYYCTIHGFAMSGTLVVTQ